MKIFWFLVLLLASVSVQAKPIRLLYWNIQYGMWDGQRDNYARFVAWVKAQDPDVCVWCEGRSVGETKTAKWLGKDPNAYLPSHVGELAARYGHAHAMVGPECQFFPQLITSKYPIESVREITGSSTNRFIVQGAGWFRVALPGGPLNVVTLHEWPQKYAPLIPVEARAASAAAHGGDRHRLVEMEEILAATHAGARSVKGDWVMLGDFNTVSRADAALYAGEKSAPWYGLHDLIAAKTDYVDLLAKLVPDPRGRVTLANSPRRIDFIYATPALAARAKNCRVVRDDYVKPVPAAGVPGMWTPSDHLPIAVEFQVPRDVYD